jgi:hypothetical protein
MQLTMLILLTNDKLKRLWKEGVVAYSRYCPGIYPECRNVTFLCCTKGMKWAHNEEVTSLRMLKEFRTWLILKDVMSCSLVESFQRFGRMCYLHLQVRELKYHHWPSSGMHLASLPRSLYAFELWCLETEAQTCHSLMELSPSWEAADCAATQELSSILWNPKVHYRVHKSPPLAPIPRQISLVHTNPSHLSEIHYNILPPTSRSS